jgi:aryl-alcohol dehydrogenase-like predicted oxidoreductase
MSGPAADVLMAVRDVAERSGATVAQVALKWLLTKPEITVAISGADTDRQIEENLAAVDLQLSNEDLARLDDVSAGLNLLFDGVQYASTGSRRK